MCDQGGSILLCSGMWHPICVPFGVRVSEITRRQRHAAPHWDVAKECHLPCRCAETSHALQVSDEGGGIPRSGLSRIWTYLYSTAHSPLEEMAKDGGDGADGPAVLAGYGYGLPISRLYARYFGGDLQVFLHPQLF